MVTYSLRAQYVGNYGGGSLTFGPYGQTFNIGAALTAGGGSFTVTDAELAAVLDRYPALYRSADDGQPLIQSVQPRWAAASVGAGLGTSDVAFEVRRSAEQHARLEILADGTMLTGGGSAPPIVAANRPFRVASQAPYGADTTGATDATSAIEAALADGGTTWLDDGTYQVTDLQPPTGSQLRGSRDAVLTVPAGSTANAILIGDSTVGVEVEGITVDMSAASVSSTAAAIQVGGTRAKVRYCFVHDAPYDGIFVRGGTSWFSVYKNEVFTTGRYGIACTGSLASPANNGQIEGNQVNDAGTTVGAGGLAISGIAAFVTFRGNTVVASGGDGLAAYNPDNLHILVVANIFRDNGNNGVHLGGDHAQVIANKIYSPAQKGIYIQSDLSPAKTGAKVTGNEIHGTDAGEGILIDNYTGVVVGPNLVLSPQTHCLSMVDCEDFSVSGGTYKGSVAGSGLRFAGCQDGTASGFTSKSNLDKGVTFLIGVAAAADCLDITVSGATIKANATGIHSTTNASGLTISAGNTVKGNTTNFSITAKTTNRVYPQNTDTSDSVASASSLTLPLGIRHFILTGATTITTIAAGNWKDQTVHLRCTGALTIQDVDTVRLNGDFPGGLNAMLTLTSDGSRWWEAARSLNA